MPRRFSRSVALASALLLGAGPAAAESALVLPMPKHFGDVQLVTYDAHGERIGDAEMHSTRDDQGVHIRGVTRLSTGAQNRVEVDLRAIDGGRALQIVREWSQSRDSQGHKLDILVVDHLKRRASCTPDDGSGGAPEVVTLPAHDHVSNVPNNLVFLPLVRGEVKRIEFQVFVCGGGARLIDFVALARPPVEDAGHRIVEVRYGPNLGRFVSYLASRVLPKLSFFFDASNDGYVGHRMPLHADGPDVIVLRPGIDPAELVH